MTAETANVRNSQTCIHVRQALWADISALLSIAATDS